MRRKLLTLLGLALIFGVWAMPAQALLSVAADADTLLSNDGDRGPTVNHGSASQTQVRWHPAPRVRITYVRFDITGLDAGRNDEVTLNGWFRDSGKDGPSDGSGVWDVYGLWDGENENWDESSVNYSNASGVDNSAAVGTFGWDASDFLGTISQDGDASVDLSWSSNTTDLPLQAFLDADTDGLVTFLIMDSVPEGSEYYIATKEAFANGGNLPMSLAIPEPSVTLLLLGGAGLLGMIRRKK